MYLSGRAELYEQQSTGISNFQFTYFLDSEIISLPPLPQQCAIAHILGTLDDKIELNRRMNETLEEMARALFKSWFVDFDPVRAKAALKNHSSLEESHHSPHEPSNHSPHEPSNHSPREGDYTFEYPRAAAGGYPRRLGSV